MEQSRPLVSVGMPVFNGERYVALAIQSILAQTFADFELIIADNASTDRTMEICQEFAANDERIRYFRHKENIGAARNYNFLVGLARGEFFRWSNADDLLAPELHQYCLDALRAEPEAVLSYGRTELIDENGSTLSSYNDNLDLRQDLPSERFKRLFRQAGLTNIIYGLMRTEAVRRTEIFADGSLPSADVTFMAELTVQGKFIEVPRRLFFRRMHPDSCSHDLKDEERQTAFWGAKSQPFKCAMLRQNAQLFRSVWRSAVSFREKIRISLHILRRLSWQRSDIYSEIVAASKVRRLFARRKLG